MDKETVPEPPAYDQADFEALVEAAQAAHPRVDRWVIEAYVAHYFKGLLSEKGELLPVPEPDAEKPE